MMIYVPQILLLFKLISDFLLKNWNEILQTFFPYVINYFIYIIYYLCILTFVLKFFYLYLQFLNVSQTGPSHIFINIFTLLSEYINILMKFLQLVLRSTFRKIITFSFYLYLLNSSNLSYLQYHLPS